ncbi:hypothetical protein TrST_g10591 [Triparma strigata]|uniref:Uncharacterized protein n=1 Tax=Triparma strigata TaxID=1606541 RepID=A0A9W6ZYI8_9STRA|nr:hypothetical protein TrST_g10591 [Triparma strigata]
MKTELRFRRREPPFSLYDNEMGADIVADYSDEGGQGRALARKDKSGKAKNTKKAPKKKSGKKEPGPKKFDPKAKAAMAEGLLQLNLTPASNFTMQAVGRQDGAARIPS